MSKEEEVKKILEEIAEGKGRYSLDPLTHASNTIEDMKDLASKALALFPISPPPVVGDLRERAIREAGYVKLADIIPVLCGCAAYIPEPEHSKFDAWLEQLGGK